MSRNAKILVGIGVGLVVCAALCCGGGYLWISMSKDELMATGDEAKKAGEDYARGREDVACLEKSFERLDKCGMMEVTCRATTTVFLSSCVRNAEQTAEFCERVPDVRGLSMTEQVTKMAMYVEAKCRNLGRSDDEKCANHVQEVVEICNDRLETK